MPQGLQLWSPSGELILDLTYRVMKVLTVEMANGASGNTTVNTGAYTITSVASAATENDHNKALPRVQITGGNVAWDYGSVPTAQRANTRLQLSAY